MKVYGNGIVIIDNSNRFEFIKFEEESEIDFFKKIDWIIDYNKVKDMSRDQIIEFGQNIALEKNKIAASFNVMSKENRNKNLHMVDECERSDFKMYSLRDIILF